jgi:threonine/homoserine/homoserine lactone efflux protein
VAQLGLRVLLLQLLPTRALLLWCVVDAALVAYLTFTVVLVLTPGATTAVVVRSALAGGRRAGLASAAGAACGNLSHAIAAGAGLAVLLARLPWSLDALRVAGAALLAWLGLRSIVNVFRLRVNARSRLQSDDARRYDRSSFAQGWMVNLGNPAIATFYLVVVPSFLRPGAPKWHFAALAAAHVLMAFACHAAWAAGLHHVRRVLDAAPARRALEGATGTAMLILATRVLLAVH